MTAMDEAARRCMAALGLDPNRLQRSASGRSYYPRDEFRTPWRFGVLFDRGSAKLYEFRPDEIHVFRGGAAPYMWCKTIERPQWVGHRPRPFRVRDMIIPDKFKRDAGMPPRTWRRFCKPTRTALAWQQFFNSLPPAACAAARNARPDVAWGVLQAVSRVPGAADWWATAPALCVMAYWHFLFDPNRRTTNPFGVTRRLLSGKLKGVTARAGFDAADTGILRKIPGRDVDIIRLYVLRKALREKPLLKKVLRHLHAPLRGYMFSMLPWPCREYLTVSLLEEVASNERGGQHIGLMLRSIHEMAELLRRNPPGPFKTLNRASIAHDELASRLQRIRLEAMYKDLSFPAAPFAEKEMPSHLGPIQLAPIRTPCALVELGRLAMNCVASPSYVEQVAGNACYIYRADCGFAGTHTLSIARRPGERRWRLAEIQAPQNRPAHDVVLDAVLRWLRIEQRVPVREDPRQGLLPLFADVPA
ncbi:MAG: hypothetical protein JXR37_05635 [Kiritimatiellae bacterium]|nr:hypothetical protein [Kiritimatiellia bacterium]